ncbi:MAG: DUF99 family protein [Nanoarchaeota archaeon]
MLKRELRVLGIDDTPFDKHRDKTATLIGIVYRGGSFPDGLLSATVRVDGTDGTAVIARMVNQSKFKEQLRAILLKGIAVAGFNLIDIRALSRRTRLPAIVVMRHIPKSDEMASALNKLGLSSQAAILNRVPKIHRAGKLLFQCAGCSQQHAAEVIALTTTHGNLPEPLRVAHLIASGITLGESRGKA